MTTARWHETILAESDRCVVLEGNAYFPPDAVRREHLRPSALRTTCPYKGEATFFDVVVGDAVNRDAAWTYATPREAAEEIAGYVAFWKGVEVA